MNKYGIILFNLDGLAICEDDFGELWFAKIPEEYAQPGDITAMVDMNEISVLPKEKQAAVFDELDRLPKEYLDALRNKCGRPY